MDQVFSTQIYGLGMKQAGLNSKWKNGVPILVGQTEETRSVRYLSYH